MPLSRVCKIKVLYRPGQVQAVTEEVTVEGGGARGKGQRDVQPPVLTVVRLLARKG